MRNTSKIKDLTGQKFNHLTVVKLASRNPIYWECVCDCGNTTFVRTSNLTRGQVKTCGCAHKRGNPTHGHSNTRLYRIYKKIIRRCYCADEPSYHNYGGRGITVCDEWKNDFMTFYNWALDNGYDESLSIDRINNDGNYEPTNCRWVDSKQQSNNRRTNKLFRYKGKTQTLMQWCEEYNVNYERVYARLSRGWNFEEAIETKDDARKHKRRVVKNE